MIETSDAFKNYLARDGRTFKMKLVSGSREYGNSDESHIAAFKIESTLGGDNIGIGNTGCAKLEVTLFDQSGVKIVGNYLKAYIGADLNGTETWEQLGEFKAEKPTVQNGAITFIGYDRMNETGKTYTSGISFQNGDVTAQALWADMCKQAANDEVHCKELPVELASIVIPEDCFSGCSVRAAMGYLAAYLGCNVVVSRQGKFEMRELRTERIDGIISPDVCETPEIEEEDYLLGYITCNRGEDKKLLTSGTGERGFSCVCPCMDEETLKAIANMYLYKSGSSSSVSYRVGSVNVIKGDFRIEVGDWLSYADGSKTYVFPVMKQTFEFDGGIMNTLESLGKTPEEESGSVLSLENRIKEAVNRKIYSVAESRASVVRDFSKAINGALGLYETEITNADGSKQTYLHNRENIAESTYIATVNAAGFAFATGEGCWNNGSPTFTSGMTADGNAVMNTIDTYKIKAEQINVTDLSALGATIGGWNIGTTYSGANGIFNTCGNYEVGMKTSSTSTAAAFYVRDKKNAKTPFWVSNEGVLNATGAKISGEITATSGEIAGITIASGYLKYGTIGSNNSFAINPAGTSSEYTVADKTGDKWALMIGSRFGVTSYGTIYATNAKISGEITATSGSFTGEIKATSGTIGGFSIYSNRFQYGQNANIGKTGSFVINPAGSSGKYTVSGNTTNGWSIIIGSNFGVLNDGTVWTTGLCAEGALLTGESMMNTVSVADALYLFKNTPIRYQTSSTAQHTVLTYDGAVKLGIDVANLRLYGKAVYLGSTSTAVTSDARLKTDIAAFTPAHEAFFKALRPRSYRYTEGTSDRTHFGFVAQEVKEAIESAGLTTQRAAAYVELESDREGFDGTEYALRYDEFISLNTHMIQKLSQEIDRLKERMTQYEGNIR